MFMANNDPTFVSISHSTLFQDINSRCMQYFNVCAVRRILEIKIQINISLSMTKNVFAIVDLPLHTSSKTDIVGQCMACYF